VNFSQGHTRLSGTSELAQHPQPERALLLPCPHAALQRTPARFRI